MIKNLEINNLSATIYLPKNDVNEVVIGIHGFAGDKESSVLMALGSALEDSNIALLTYDLPCHGHNDNTKPLNLNECIRSVETMVDYVHENFKGAVISFFATSFGGYLLLSFLNNNPLKVGKIILRAPAITMYKTLTKVLLPEVDPEKLTSPIEFGYENTLLIDKNFYNDLAKNNLNDFNFNHFIYVLQGKKDDVVSVIDNAQFYQKYFKDNHKIYYFENADHRFKNSGELEELVRITLSILRDKQK